MQLKALTRFRHIKYGEIENRIARIASSLDGKVCLVVDATGPGEETCDHLISDYSLPVFKLYITGGAKVNHPAPYQLTVPKTRLVWAGQVVIEGHKSEIPRQLGDIWKIARDEFSHFAMKHTASGDNLTYESLRSSQHDDTVLSILMAIWMSTKEYIVVESTEANTIPGCFSSSYGSTDANDTGIDSMPPGLIEEVLSGGSYASGQLPSNDSLRRRIKGEIW